MGQARSLGKLALAALAGAVVGSISMLVYVNTHFAPAIQPFPTALASTSAPVSAAASDEAASDQTRIVNAVKRVMPSVVALQVTVNGRQYVPADPFSRLFGGPSTGQTVPFQARASASGFVYSKDGLIVTNAHVVQFGRGANLKIEVLFQNGDRVPARLYSANPAVDLALIKVDNYAKLPAPVELGTSSSVAAGQWAIAIGEPFELQESVSVGVVSGFNRTETVGSEPGIARTFKGLLQTSAPINPGNSGGPLIDYHGRLIGVNQSTASPQAGAQGIGFAIPVDTVKQQLALLERSPGQTVEPSIPYIGVSLLAVDDNVRARLNYNGNGVAIEGVYQGGPADQAGVQPGDVIRKIDGQDVTSVEQVQDHVRAAKPGQALRLELWHSGLTKTISVKVGTAPEGVSAG